MSHEVWTRAASLGRTLAQSPQLEGIQRVFDHDDPTGPMNPGERAFSELLAAVGMLRSRPLLAGIFAATLPPMPANVPYRGYEELLRIPEFHTHVDDAQMAGETLLVVIEHLRARLPGYPELAVPALLDQSPRVEMNGLFASGMPWLPALRSRQFTEPPAPMVREVAADAWHGDLRALDEALEATAEWTAFARTTESLTDEGRCELAQACEDFERRADPAIVDEEVGLQLVARAEYTRAIIDDMTAGLHHAAEYAAAFDRVDTLISNAAAVLSDCAVYARPIEIPASAEVAWRREGETVLVSARFDEGSPFITPGRLFVYSGEPPVRGGWIGTGTTISLNFSGQGSRISLDAVVLADSEGLLDLAAS